MKQNCETPGCKHDPQGRKFCGTCRTRKSREADPVRYAYGNLKHRAKERNKEFTLTLEEFREFCVRTEYMKGKGKTIGSYNVDRIDETKGYTADNIQCLDKQKNIKKYLDYNWQEKTARAVECLDTLDVEDMPF
jgi:hypothetical protein